MEPMVTLWKHPDFLPVHELCEANWAICGRDIYSRSVHGDRNLAQSAFLKSRGSQPSSRLIGGLKGEPPAAPEGASHNRIQSKGANQRAEQSRKYDHHVGVEICLVTVGSPSWRSIVRHRIRLFIKQQAVWTVVERSHDRRRFPHEH